MPQKMEVCPMEWIVILVLIALLLLLVVSNIVIVQQSRAYVVERLGAFRTVWNVGLHLKVPFIERIAKKVSLKEQVVDFAAPARHHQGQRHHADRHGHLLPDHRPQALHLRRGAPHERH